MERKVRAQDRIKKKILVLERWLAHEVPSGACIPKNITQFRLWEDDEFNVEKIGSPNTMDRPHNKALKLKATELIRLLITRKGNERKGVTELHRLQAQRLVDKRLVQDLVSQLQVSEQSRIQAEGREGRALKRLEEANERIAELTAQITAIVPLHRVV